MFFTLFQQAEFSMLLYFVAGARGEKRSIDFGAAFWAQLALSWRLFAFIGSTLEPFVQLWGPFVPLWAPFVPLLRSLGPLCAICSKALVALATDRAPAYGCRRYGIEGDSIQWDRVSVE
jgi:hypothetical protein